MKDESDADDRAWDQATFNEDIHTAYTRLWPVIHTLLSDKEDLQVEAVIAGLGISVATLIVAMPPGIDQQQKLDWFVANVGRELVEMRQDIPPKRTSFPLPNPRLRTFLTETNERFAAETPTIVGLEGAKLVKKHFIELAVEMAPASAEPAVTSTLTATRIRQLRMNYIERTLKGNRSDLFGTDDERDELCRLALLALGVAP